MEDIVAVGIGQYRGNGNYSLCCCTQFLKGRVRLIIADVLFYFLAFFAVFFAILVVVNANPVHAALSLVLSMVTLAFLFMNMGALLAAGVQLIVYAGAVMVLFVMVMMLFDLRKELRAYSVGRLSNILKVGTIALVAGLLLGVVFKSSEMVGILGAPNVTVMKATQIAAQLLFTKYVFAFEVVSVLLLVVVVGAVALSRIVGGTHAK